MNHADILGIANKVAIVTGSTRGIGNAIAILLAESGARVFLNGRSKESLVEAVCGLTARGLSAEGLEGDISDERFTRTLVERVIDRWGRVDILINGAGIPSHDPIEEIDSQRWDQCVNTNLKSAFLASRECIPAMKKQRSGKIVNITSTAALRGRSWGVDYVAAKSGLIGLTKGLARELGPFHIQVNAIAPGLTNSRLQERGIDQKFVEDIARLTPLKRIAEPADIAKAALFFSSALSDFITGQVLMVDGGFAI